MITKISFSFELKKQTSENGEKVSRNSIFAIFSWAFNTIYFPGHFHQTEKTMAIKDFLIFISLYEKKYINLSPDYHVSILYWVKTSSCKKDKETAHAVWSMVKSKDISVRSGLGWDDNPRHIKGVYSTRSLRHIESSKFINLSLERSNGRCPGV